MIGGQSGEDRAAFESFAASTGPGLVRFATVLTGDVEEAQDLTQECLIRVAAAWHRIDRVAAVRYAHRVLVRLNLNVIRGRGRERRAVDRLVGDAIGGDPQDEFLDYRWLRALVADLSPRQRQAIALVYFFDYSPAEAAEMMRCSHSTLRTHLERALTVLRSQPDVLPATTPNKGPTQR